MEFSCPWGEFPGKSESMNLSRDDLGGEIGRTAFVRPAKVRSGRTAFELPWARGPRSCDQSHVVLRVQLPLYGQFS